MTRIFDALKKSQAAREPAVVPAPTVLHPVRPAITPGTRPMIERIDVVPLAPIAPFDASVQREMSALRVNLEGSLATRSPRSLMLVAAQPGEGTSTVTLQFAQALASEAGLRVLVVDAHPTRSSPLLDSARGGPEASMSRGALDLLPLGDRLRRSGPIPVASARDLIEAAGTGYDWMLIDGPPLLESPEAAPLAAQFEGVVIVIRAGRTKRPVLVRALDLLRRSGANVLGTILNRRQLEIPNFLYRRI